MSPSFLPPVGSICRATRGRTEPRLVLVVQSSQRASDAVCRVHLLTNETEMATNTEAFLPASRPGRAYDLLVHEFPGYMRAVNLSAPLSTVDIAQDLRRYPAMPLTRRSDPRWAWKLAELAAMQALQPPLAVILGEQPD